MKHASSATIERLSPMLANIRSLGTLVEKKPGVFYWKSRAFLHFHEHEDEIYADVRFEGTDFERRLCSSRRDQNQLVTAIRNWLDHQPAGALSATSPRRSRGRNTMRLVPGRRWQRQVPRARRCFMKKATSRSRLPRKPR